MTKKRVLGTLTLCFLLATGCSKDDSKSNGNPASNTETAAAKLEGAYQSTKCFKNQSASQGMGQNIYTQAKMTFQADLSGSVEFHLYSDQACTQLLGSGTNNIQAELERSTGDVQIMKFTQTDPSNPGSSQIYWLGMHLTTNGAYIDIDGERSGVVGPYLSVPSDQDIADFIANPTQIGIFFSK